MSSAGSPSIQAPKRAYMDIVDSNVNDGYTEIINDDSSTGECSYFNRFLYLPLKFINAGSQPVLAANGNAGCTNGDSSIGEYHKIWLILIQKI